MSELLIRGGTIFDGSGAPGRVADLLVRDGRVAAIGPELEAPPGAEVIEAEGRWVTPGFVDIHTHYDAELEVGPALFESVRHGVTTVVTGSCSLSMAVGRPEDMADMFCRVEAIPREVVLPRLEEVVDWDGPAGYLEHVAALPLGPNVACLLGHSTIRAAAMGMERAVERGARPTEGELQRMDDWLREALDAGYVGMSISTLPWDKMDGEIYRSRPMPSVFASWSEYRHLARQLRARGRVLQAVPNITNKLNFPLFLLISAGFGLRRALKTTVISMMDIRSDRYAFRLAGWMARVVNRFFGGDFRLQALPEPFELWADGIDLVVFEELEAGTAALHLKDEVARNALLADPAYRARFKQQWRSRFLPRAFHRDLGLAEVVGCPDQTLVGQTFAQIGAARGQDPVDAFLDLVIEHGAALRWYTVMGNDRPEWLRWIVSHPDILLGFSDAGAHLRNMAHYNFPLRLLRMAHEAEQQGQRSGSPFMSVARAVQRATSEIADWLGLDAGTLAVGRRADVVVIDPRGLDGELDRVHEEPLEAFGLSRLVQRNDAAVDAVLINGRVAARAGVPAPDLGREAGYGRLLRAGAPDPGGAATPAGVAPALASAGV
ncbi:MAG: amidohydrolase family protein [Planctomycetota bacterium]